MDGEAWTAASGAPRRRLLLEKLELEKVCFGLWHGHPEAQPRMTTIASQ